MAFGMTNTPGILEATTTAPGLMSAKDKALFDGLSDCDIIQFWAEYSTRSLGIHNALYGGGEIQNGLTEELLESINSGELKNIYIGLRFIFNNVPYSWVDAEGVTHNNTYSGTMRVAYNNYYIRSGDNGKVFNKPHIVVVPDGNLFLYKMNPTATTEGGYAGCDLRTNPAGLLRAKALAEACFGEGTVLPHRVYLQNAVTNGRPSGGAWIDSIGVELMTEQEVYGGLIFDSGAGTGANVYMRKTVDYGRFCLFQYLANSVRYPETGFWLQNVVSSSEFAAVASTGLAYYYPANQNIGVRPAIVLGKPE